MSTNIIKFPKMKLDTPPMSEEELFEKITEYKKSYADDISEFLWQHVIGELARSGCDFQSKADELFPSIVLVHESIKSLHLHANGVHHPLQDFAAEAIDEEDEKLVDIDDEME